MPMMAVGVDLRGESYGLLIDTIGDVLKVSADSCDVNPVNMDTAMARVSAGVHRLQGHLMVILDVEKVLDMSTEALAA
jgi:purine-binding chemotaxis protein CheW